MQVSKKQSTKLPKCMILYYTKVQVSWRNNNPKNEICDFLVQIQIENQFPTLPPYLFLIHFIFRLAVKRV